MARWLTPGGGNDEFGDDEFGDDEFGDDDPSGFDIDDELEAFLRDHDVPDADARDAVEVGRTWFGAGPNWRHRPEFADRRAFVEGASRETLRRVIDRQPLLGAALCGVGRLSSVIPRGRGSRGSPDSGDPHPLTIDDLADALSSTLTIAAAVEALSPQAAHLLEVAVWHGGGLSAQAAAAACPEADPAALSAAAAELGDVVVSDPAKAFVHVRPGVAHRVLLPGPLVRQVYVGSAITNGHLDHMLKKLGVAVPARREPKVEALEHALRNPDVITATVQRLTEPARALLGRLLAMPSPTRLAKIGIGYFVPIDPTYLNVAFRSARMTPLHELHEHGLVYVDPSGVFCSVWLDAIVGLNGGRLGPWPAASPIAIGPIHDDGAHPASVGRLQAILDLWSREPAPGTKSGVLTVQAMRAAGKQLGIQERDVKLLAGLAVAADLLERVTTWSGRGRNETHAHHFRTSAMGIEWTGEPYGIRWGMLVQAWLSAAGTEEFGDEVDRRVAARDLLDVEVGCGPMDVVGYLTGRRRMFRDRPDQLAETCLDMVALGLVPSDGPRGLTRLARTLLTDPDALVAAMPAVGRSFVVQADHTVVAPPDLDPDVAARLARLATIESKGSASVWRLDPRRVATQVADGCPAADIAAFLTEFSSTPVPPGIIRLVEDAARAAGGLSAHSATTVITAADPVSLAKAVAVKAAKLTGVSPTTAVSSLPLAKVLTALRAKGLAPTAPGLSSSGRGGAGDGSVGRDARRPATLNVRLLASVPSPADVDRWLPR